MTALREQCLVLSQKRGLQAAGLPAAMSLLVCIAACGGGSSAGPSKAPAQVLSSLAVAITYDAMRVGEAAHDDRGNQGIGTVPFTRGTRGGKGTTLPPRNK